MEPVSVDLLLAVASSVEGALGERLWSALVALAPGPIVGDRGDEGEVAVLRRRPDERAAIALAAVLRTLADRDDDFRTALLEWCARAREAVPSRGYVSNTITGGSQYAPVIQGRDITNLIFNVTPAVPTGPSRSRDGEAADRPTPVTAEGPVQLNTARDDATLYAVENGDMHIHHHHSGPDSD
jgi:hypothetical protein